MKDETQKALRAVESERTCRVLFAVESGSRAWGFASPDSDYDVRFVFVHPRAEYLRLKEPNESIDRMLPGDIDLSGWELRKTLRLFASCNLALNEWIGSPVVYGCDESLRPALAELTDTYFNPKRGMFHYLSMANNVRKDHWKPEGITIKKLFYILRPILAAEWISQTGSMPPTEFERLRVLEPEGHTAVIDDLLKHKAAANENAPITVPAPLAAWIDEAAPRLDARAHEIEAKPNKDMDALDSILRSYIG